MWLILPKALTKTKRYDECHIYRGQSEIQYWTYLTVPWIRRSGKAGSRTSPGMAIALPPAALMSAATRSALANGERWLKTWPSSDRYKEKKSWLLTSIDISDYNTGALTSKELGAALTNTLANKEVSYGESVVR